VEGSRDGFNTGGTLLFLRPFPLFLPLFSLFLCGVGHVGSRRCQESDPFLFFPSLSARDGVDARGNYSEAARVAA